MQQLSSDLPSHSWRQSVKARYRRCCRYLQMRLISQRCHTPVHEVEACRGEQEGADSCTVLEELKPCQAPCSTLTQICLAALARLAYYRKGRAWHEDEAIWTKPSAVSCCELRHFLGEQHYSHQLHTWYLFVILLLALSYERASSFADRSATCRVKSTCLPQPK